MCHCILAHKSNNGMFHCVRLSVLISEIIHVFFYILLIPKYLLSAPQADLLSMSNKVWLQYMLCTFYKVIYQFKAKKISKRSMMCFGFHFTLIYSSFFLQNIFYAFFFFYCDQRYLRLQEQKGICRSMNTCHLIFILLKKHKE